jgi:hypothetical protein
MEVLNARGVEFSEIHFERKGGRLTIQAARKASMKWF